MTKVLNTPPAIAEASVKPAPSGVVGLGAFVFDCDNGLLSQDGAEIPLPPRAVGVLTCLIERAGDVVPKQALLDRVWKDTFVTEVSLVEAISLLRQTLRDDPQRPSFIQTVPRRGYRLVAPVRPLEGTPIDSRDDRARELRDLDEVDRVGPARPRTSERPLAEEPVWPAWLGWTFATVAVGALAAVSAGLLQQPGVRERPVVRFVIETNLSAPARHRVSPLMAVSPDGRHVVFVAATSTNDSEPRLYLREIDRLELRALAGTEGAAAPFFSPDGQWIGFFAHRSLKKVPVTSGPVVALTDAPHTFGGTWLSDDTIVFGGGRTGGLSRVSARGGTPTTLTTPDLDTGEIRHAWPDVTPKGRGVIFTALAADGAPESARVAAVDLGTGRVHALVAPAVYGRLAAPGHLLFARGGALLAAPFDEDTWNLVGPAVTALREPIVDAGSGVPQLAVSKSGVLVTSAPIGGSTGDDMPPGLFGSVDRSAVRASNLSSRGRLAMAVGDGDGVDLYVSDTAGSTRLTARGGIARPVWTADGRSIIYASRAGSPFNLFLRPAEPNAAETRLTTSPRSQLPSDLSADGSMLVYTQVEPETGMDIWLLPLDGTSAPTPAVRAPGDQTGGVLSPDNRWLVYLTDAAGVWDVMLQDRSNRALPDRLVAERAGTRLAFSPDGRMLTVRRRDGRTICSVSEHGLDCRHEVGLSTGEGPPVFQRFEVVLDWSRELAAQVPSPQQPVRSVR